MINPAHYLRQMDIISPLRLRFPIAIIGAGGIGSWTALSLGKLGCDHLTIFDFDVVEEQNIGCQYYTPKDLEGFKVEQLTRRLGQVLENRPKGLREKITVENAKQLLNGFEMVIAAVDNIEVRKTIFEALKGTHVNYIDGRMAADALQLFTISMGNPQAVAFYEESLFPPQEAEEMPCTAQATVYNGFVIAGFIGSLVAKIAQNCEVPKELIIDLKNYEMVN